MPPYGIDLAAYATISADLAEADRPFADILGDHALTDAQWLEVSSYWADRMTSDAREAALAGAEPRVTLDFSDAFARAQDGKRPLPALDARGWAVLRRDVDRVGPHEALARRGLGLADYGRLVRHWAQRIATDGALAAELSAVEESFEDSDKGV